MDYTQHLACHGCGANQHSTGIPLFRSNFVDDEEHGEHITTQGTFFRSIFLCLDACFNFRLKHRLHGRFLDYQNDKQLILSTFGGEVLEGFRTTELVIYLILHDSARSFLGNAQYRHNYRSHHASQPRKCVAVLLAIWQKSNVITALAGMASRYPAYGPSARRFRYRERMRLAAAVYRVLLDKEDDWNAAAPHNQFQHNLGSRLRKYLQMIHHRSNTLHNSFGHQNYGIRGTSYERVEYYFDHFLYEYYTFFGLHRQALPAHFQIPHHPPPEHAGDDLPEVAFVPLPQILGDDDDGGDE